MSHDETVERMKNVMKNVEDQTFKTGVVFLMCIGSLLLGVWLRGLEPVESEYATHTKLLGDYWQECTPEIVATLYQFRLECREANVPASDYENILTHIVKPTLSNDGYSDKCRVVNHLLAVVQGKESVRNGDTIVVPPRTKWAKN